MSVIAWDGTMLAADRRAVMGTLIRTTTKIFRVGDALAAYAGDADAGEEVLAWFVAGHDAAKFPTAQRDKDNWAGLLVVWPDGWLWKYERTPHPLKFPPQQFAIGSGRDFALAAMHCGKTAPEAVEVACIFDSGCGNGVDVLIHGGGSGND
jgi:ATP-dependent protease HslVU (ClpYQ) peptidase subunit